MVIRTLSITNDLELLQNLPLDQLSDPKIEWYWVDFNAPTEEDAMMLEHHFHPLAIEDCFHYDDLNHYFIDFHPFYLYCRNLRYEL
jgi:magnesium transporter